MRIVTSSILVAVASALAVVGVVSVSREVGWMGLLNERHWGRVTVRFGQIDIVHARVSSMSQPPVREGFRSPVLGSFGFRAGTSRRWRYHGLTCPVWAVVAVLTIQPAVALIRGPVLGRRRKRRNECPSCGYSLVGCVSDACPECGSPRASTDAGEAALAGGG